MRRCALPVVACMYEAAANDSCADQNLLDLMKGTGKIAMQTVFIKNSSTSAGSSSIKRFC
jgi:hypothetical protein